MHQLLKCIEDNKVEDIFNNRGLYYYFLKTCVREVVGKTKWKENCFVSDYTKIVHPTDESFALLVLDNNVARYKDMISKRCKKSEVNPRYTMVTKKGQKIYNRGWSDAGKLKFQEYTKLVMSKRNDMNWLKDKIRYVLKKSKKAYKKRKMALENDAKVSNRRMNEQERDEWNDFLCDNMNNKEWAVNSVAI